MISFYEKTYFAVKHKLINQVHLGGLWQWRGCIFIEWHFQLRWRVYGVQYSPNFNYIQYIFNYIKNFSFIFNNFYLYAIIIFKLIIFLFMHVVHLYLKWSCLYAITFIYMQFFLFTCNNFSSIYIEYDFKKWIWMKRY